MFLKENIVSNIIILSLGSFLGYYGLKYVLNSHQIFRKDYLFFFLTITYLTIELLLNNIYKSDHSNNIQFANSGFGFFNHKCAVFDSISGYKWLKGEHRTIKFSSRDILYDVRFKANKQGYVYHSDFKHKKNKNKRWIILGDSFTSTEYLANPFANELEKKFFNNNKQIEFYPFALSGIGIRNWHSIFFKEIVPNYEFDGIIINFFGNDLKRDFFVMHHTDTMGWTGYLNEIPNSFQQIKSDIKNNLQPSAPILKDEKIDSIKKFYSNNKTIYDLYALRYLFQIKNIFDTYRTIKKIKDENFTKSNVLFKIDEYEDKFGTAGRKQLESIFSFCKKNKIPIVVSYVPYNMSLEFSKNGYMYNDELYIKYIAQKNDVFYFNCDSIYKTSTNINNCFFESDIHWNENGMEIFIDNLYQFLIPLI